MSLKDITDEIGSKAWDVIQGSSTRSMDELRYSVADLRSHILSQYATCFCPYRGALKIRSLKHSRFPDLNTSQLWPAILLLTVGCPWHFNGFHTFPIFKYSTFCLWPRIYAIIYYDTMQVLWFQYIRVWLAKLICSQFFARMWVLLCLTTTLVERWAKKGRLACHCVIVCVFQPAQYITIFGFSGGLCKFFHGPWLIEGLLEYPHRWQNLRLNVDRTCMLLYWVKTALETIWNHNIAFFTVVWLD